MSERVYVALDLETTGLDAQQDAIIEIGAVRFAFEEKFADERYTHHCRIIDRFVTFVNPNRPIPIRVQQITGICDADVAQAPSIDRVLPELLGFVTSNVRSVVAHNADFDFAFLNAAGVNLHRPVQDTFELASILLPRMSSYNLGELCKALEVSLNDAHRALDDAEATAHLFCLLLAELRKLPVNTINILLVCGHESDWSPLLLMEDIHPGVSSHQDQPGEPDITTRAQAGDAPDSLILDQGPPPRPVTSALLTEMFTTDGPLGKQMGAAYERRQGQVDMARRTLNALNVGDHLLIEAGTGTGKSLAYLAPAAAWSLINQRRVVIATNTIALQDQLIDKEIPQVQALMDRYDYGALRAALLKGRQNYLCTRRLYAWYNNRYLSPVELRVLAKILVWLPITRTGDVSELFLPTAAERSIWNRICSDTSTCAAERCIAPVDIAPHDTLRAPHVAHAFQDYFFAARRDAEAAHLLIVNHALLMADIVAGGRLLPPYSHLIVDEAHRLEEAATEQLTYRIDWRIVQQQLIRLQPNGELWSSLFSASSSRQDRTCQRFLTDIAWNAKQAARGLRTFAESLASFATAQDRSRNEPQYARRLPLDRSQRTLPMWSELEIDWDTSRRSLHALIELVANLAQRLVTSRWPAEEPYATYLLDLQGLKQQLGELHDWLDAIIFHMVSERASQSVTWIETSEPDHEVQLVAAPLSVNNLIERELIHKKRSIVLTGATLRTGSGFSFIRDRLGLWDVTASTVESPFDYQASTLLYLPGDVPEPDQPYYQSAVEQAIIAAAIACEGATLALFTSYAQLHKTAEAIRKPLDQSDITVLEHGTSSRRRLLREYRATQKAVLLGTRSFWEGIDLPGDELRCLLIVRLPFAVPTDPIVAARTQELENPFLEYTLPDAILRFRQGFGRLIRRASDRGVVVVLDSRVWRKSYGQAFLESLPKCTIRHAPLANLEAGISHWLRETSHASSPAHAP